MFTGIAGLIGAASPIAFVSGFASAAVADTTINGCTIVANPTEGNHTNCPGASLYYVNLSGLDLAFANLAGANLTGADLSGINGFEINLSGADLQGAVLSGTVLNYGNVHNASFTDSIIRNSQLFRTDLSESSFCAAAISGDDFAGSDVSGASFTGCIGEGFYCTPMMINTGSCPNGQDFPGADITSDNFSYADFISGTNFTGAKVSGSDFTGTILVPTDVTVGATSAAGASVTWAAPAPLAGLTPSGCNHASGSNFPIGTTTVACFVTDAFNGVSEGAFTVTVVDTPPTTKLLFPTRFIVFHHLGIADASASSAIGIRSVQFVLTGGSYDHTPIATAIETPFGWIALFKTKSIPDGIYELQSLATDNAGVSALSNGVAIGIDRR